MIIIEYDQNPRVPYSEKLRTLAESVQMALAGVDKELSDRDKKIDQLAKQIAALEAVADDAIIVDSSVTT